MRKVIIESPYAGTTQDERNLNIQYARAAVKDCLVHGEAPFASHLLYTQLGILDDDRPEERAMGINAGLAWQEAAEAIIVYTDRGISPGMLQGIRSARDKGLVIEYRSLYEVPWSKEVLACQLDGNRLGAEISPEMITRAASSGLVVIFADGLGLHLKGAINDSYTFGDVPATTHIDGLGFLPSWGTASQDEAGAAAYFERKPKRKEIVLNLDTTGIWNIITGIPTATFDIKDSQGATASVGAVLSIESLL